MATEKTGRIEHWDEIKGYGFVVPDDGGDSTFFRVEHVLYRSPAVGDLVRYRAKRDSYGLRARDLEFLG